MTALNGTIDSPQYPNKYPTLVNCLWLMDFGYGMNVTFTFNDFELENQEGCTYDFVALYAGYNASYPRIGDQYCAFNLPPPRTVNGPLSLQFKSDFDTEFRGFSGEYFTTDINECQTSNDCHFYSFCTNTIGSYNCDCKYSFQGDGKTCTWVRDYDECAENKHNCHVNGECVDTKNEFYCRCKTGFIGDGIFCEDVNECTTTNSSLKHKCHQNASCTNTFGNYTCKCIDVYLGDGFQCQDRNECELELDTCHDNATCTNTDGSYSCKCLSGFTGDGFKCQDINECKGNLENCDENAFCTNTLGSYICTCNVGYTGSGKLCTDVNECELGTDNCHVDAVCMNNNGSYNCSCKNGFAGNGTYCQDLDECSLGTDNCHLDAVCQNRNGSFHCLCHSGYWGNGTTCEDINECDENSHNCHSDGYCTNTKGSFFCNCSHGYHGNGTNCYDINECSVGNHKCHIDATCSNLKGSFNCSCNHGYIGNGTFCQDVNECLVGTHNCHHDSTCTNTKGSFNCSCNPGYDGNGTYCKDINECNENSHNCHSDGYCTNTKGSFFCNCSHGYQGNGTYCYDINECDENSHNCHSDGYCTNTKGSFFCNCSHGYYGNGTHCHDINECDENSHNCHSDGYCTNTKGSFFCNCSHGYYGNGTHCADINECDENSHNCHSDGYCANTKGSFFCICSHGYHGNGTHCHDINECDENSHNCHSDGYCTNTKGSFFCNCSHGYQGNGTYCYDINECSIGSHNCHMDANCSNMKGSFNCSCNHGYKGNGSSCKDINECLYGTHNCHRDSRCTNQKGSFSCSCNHGYKGNGTNCEDINECDENFHNCHSDGYCTNTKGSFFCNCSHGYYGNRTYCADINECDENFHNCHSDGYCTNTKGSFFCNCSHGYHGNGTHCYDINECSIGNHNCHTDATCANMKGSFNCSCNDGYKGNGTFCQDINECDENSHNCHSDGYCTNTNGRFLCNCSHGYQGNGTHCYDMNECNENSHNCHSDGYCTNTKGSFFCNCSHGYQGNGTHCHDFDECSANTHTCYEDAFCQNIKGSYQCKCNLGFEGNGTQCTDIDECVIGSHDCHVDAICINSKGSWECKCKQGLSGNGKSCSDILECSSDIHQCDANATCIEQYSNYSCQCNKGFSGNGSYCGDIDECSSSDAHDCHTFSTCINTFGSYHCQCNQGFIGNGYQCADINECSNVALNDCHRSRGTCENTLGSYNCSCRADFVGDGINCTVAMLSYLFIVSMLDQPWHNNLLQSSSNQYKALKATVNKEMQNLYSLDEPFVSSEVIKFTFGGKGKVKAEMLVNFKPSSVPLINKLEAATIRGRVEGLIVDPSSYQLSTIGSCADVCTSNSYCLKSSSGLSYCACADGYEGSGKQCIDVNECDNMNGFCSQSCVNVKGSYYCQCSDKFKLSADQRTCQAVSASDGSTMKYCKEDYRLGVMWDDSVVGSQLSKKCPNNPKEGSARRKCSMNGMWRKPYLNECINNQLKLLAQQLRGMNMSSITWQMLKAMLSSVSKAIYPPMNVLYAGDIAQTKRLVNSISSYANAKISGQPLHEVQSMLDHFNEVFNNIFDVVNHESWQGFPDALTEIESYLALMKTIATIFSDYMILEMEKLSIKNPESVVDFAISSKRPEISIHISLVEMRSFNNSRYMLPKNSSNDYRVVYPADYYLSEVNQLLFNRGIYRPIGCYADYSREASKFSLEAKHPLLKDNYLSRVDAIHKCGYVADKLGYNIFVLQDGGLCASGSTMHKIFDKDGRADNCAYGKGGIFANSVYEINKFYSGILTTSHKHLSRLIKHLSHPSRLPMQPSPVEVFGEVVTTFPLKYAASEQLATPVEISFVQKTVNMSTIYCVQLRQNNNTIEWSTDACLTFISDNRVTCNCSRLSHQTLIYNITTTQKETNDEDNRYKTLSYVSFAVVCVSFVITLILHIFTSMGKVALVFQINLTILTISTNAIFIFGIGSEWSLENGLCKALTVLFHFLLTSLFSWFLALSWNSYHRLSDVIKQTSKDRTNIYLLLGYGCPCVVSLLAMAIFYDKFGMKTPLCWISDSLMVSMFLPPLAILIIMNIVVLGMVIGVYFSPRANSSADSGAAFELEKDEILIARDTIRASSLMLPLVTVTWVFGVLRMIHDSEATKYVFLIFNLLSGVAYLIAFCLLNRQMKNRLPCNEHEKDDYIIDSPALANLSLNRMRASSKHAFNNEGFMTSPKMKATAYDGKTFTNIAKNTIPTEVLFEMQQQWYNRKPDY